MLNIIKKILYFCIPFIELKNAEKTIDKQIKDFNSKKLPLTVRERMRVKSYEIQKFYDDTFLTKEILENKAKLGILGVTIMIGIVFSVTSNYEKLSIMSLILLIFSLIYSFIAGYLALSILSDKNKVYKLSIKDLLLKNGSKKEALLMNYELNTKQNIIRQNYVYSSYRHLTYASVIIIIAFLLNIFLYKTNKIDNHLANKNRTITIKIFKY